MKKEIKQLKLFNYPPVVYLTDALCVFCGSKLLVSKVLSLTPGEPCKRFRKICNICLQINKTLKR